MSSSEKQAKYFPAKTSPMLPVGTFQNKVAFITGGGTGLGKGMATMLATLGASVAIASRRLDVLEKTAAEIATQTSQKVSNPNVQQVPSTYAFPFFVNEQVIPIQLDVRDPNAVRVAVDRCVEQLGLPDVVINNAAGNFIAPTQRISPNAWRTIVDIVLNGTAYVTLDIAKRLISAEKGGNFLSITTTYATSGTGFTVPSAASKAGVENLTKSLTSEWSRYGLRFNCIAPGPIYTEGAFSRLDPNGQFRSFAKTAVGRLGTIEELANLAAYLVSDYSSWITGQVVTLDGGRSRLLSGEMNKLLELDNDAWNEVEALIRKTKNST